MSGQVLDTQRVDAPRSIHSTLPAASTGSSTRSSASPAAWDRIAEVLRDSGIRQVFGLPDDDMLAQLALERAGIRTVWAVSQRSAVHMAAGAALAQRSPTVCVIGRGPAVAAAVPGMLEALFAGAPVVLIAAGTAEDRREAGSFQDAPGLDMMKPVTRWAARVPSAARAADMLRSALARVRSAPSGPAYLEIPDEPSGENTWTGLDHSVEASNEQLRERLQSAERPVLLLGGGAAAVPEEELVRLAACTGAAVLTTASGRGAFQESTSRYLGLAGLYMSDPVAELVGRADVVLAIGSRLEETAMTGMPKTADWVQINAAVEHVVSALPGLHQVRDAGDLRSLLPTARPRPEWNAAVDDVREQIFRAAADSVTSVCAAVLGALSDALPDDCVVVHENGLHDIWSYSFPHFVLPDGARSVAPSEQTTLGFGVAAAAGIVAADHRLVACIGGDTALATFQPDLGNALARPGRLLYIIFDDGGMGWLDREAQRAGARHRFAEQDNLSLWDLHSERIITVAAPIDAPHAVVRGIDGALAGRPTILRVLCDPEDIAPLLRRYGGVE